MKTKIIYKFNIDPMTENFIEAPRGSKILSCQIQHGMIAVWVLVDIREELIVKKKINIIGTGIHMDEDPGEFIGTVQMGDLVLHIFDGEKNDNRRSKPTDNRQLSFEFPE